jgi:hypothetical protein
MTKPTGNPRGRPAIQDADYNAARARKMEADAQLAELELLKAKRELVSSADVLSAWVDVLGAMRGKLLSLPTKVAPLIATETEIGLIQHIVEQQVREALDELSAYQPSDHAGRANITASSSDGSDGGSETASKVKSKRVGRPRKASVVGE